MPNAPADMKLVIKAQIEALALAARTAIQVRDVAKFQEAEKQLLEMSQSLDTPALLANLAKSVHDDMAGKMTDAGLAEFAKKAKALSGATTALKAAMDKAAKAKNDLFFPKLTSAADKALKTLNTLEASVGKVGDDVKLLSAATLAQVPAHLKQVIDDVKAVRTAIATKV